MVWGNPCEDLEPGLAETLSAAGGIVVDDSLHSGRSYFSYQVPQTPSPLEGLAEAFLHRDPCPTVYGREIDLADHLIDLARQAEAQGVVILLPQFCEIYAFDYPYLKERLEREELPHLMVETDHSGASARVRTRIEAFVEAIRAT